MRRRRARVWVDVRVALAVHEEQLAEHGGRPGIRDRGLLESAMARPLNLDVLADGGADTAALAAAYLFGIVRNHPFTDGNKRTGFVVMELFLTLNGHELAADDAACVALVLGLASGALTEADAAEWVRERVGDSEF